MKAVVIGASGATGKPLVKQLLNDKNFNQVTVLVRRPTFGPNPKLTEVITNFSDWDQLTYHLNADVAFSCLGTTLKDAGSEEAQWKIDHDLNLEFAKKVCEYKVSTFVLVSAVNANSKSKIFYNCMKGSLEDAVKKLCYSRLIILQPGGLIRENSQRASEVFAVKALKFLNNLGLFTSYRPIPTAILAKSMIRASQDLPRGVHTIDLKTILRLAQ